MFYKQFSEIIDSIGQENVEKFDFWLATLPKINQNNISASVVSSKLGIKYSVADVLLRFSERQGILEKYYLVRCPSCDMTLLSISENRIAEVLNNEMFCDECECNKNITTDEIYVVFRLILRPDVPEEAIAAAIKKKLERSGIFAENFQKADSLSYDLNSLYKAFYDPSESAYSELLELRKNLDLDYGANTTEKGKALESLVLRIFAEIHGVKCSPKIKVGKANIPSGINQLDCTGLSGINTPFPSVFNYLTPYFVVECKNENGKKPDNTYLNKLTSILDTNDAQLGIVWGRLDARSSCDVIAREHYLLHKERRQQQLLLTFSDSDLSKLLDEHENLLEYLDFKIFQVTANSFDSKFEDFESSKQSF